MRALAVMADARLPEYPDVPTLKELGYATGKGLWSALYAPAATPRDVLETLHKAAVQSLNSEPVQTAFKKQMIKAIPNAIDRDAQAWNQVETALLEEGHRRGEGRAAGLSGAASSITRPGRCDSQDRGDADEDGAGARRSGSTAS